jgi:hypothetical protein
MIGEGIECVNDDGRAMVVGSSTITATTGAYKYSATDIFILII